MRISGFAAVLPPLMFLLRLLLLHVLLLQMASVARAADGDLAPLHRYSYQTWSTEYGLPQVSVRDIIHTSDGLVWVATENGLARFDGVAFHTYTATTTPAFTSSWITRLYRDRHDRLWAASLRELVSYENGEFRRHALPEAQIGRVLAMTMDARDRMWIAADQLLVADDSGQFQIAPHWRGRASALIAVADDIWVAGEDGRYARAGKDGVWQQFNLPDGRDLIINDLLWHDGYLWLATSRGLYRHDAQSGRVELRVADVSINSMDRDRSGMIWAGGDANLLRVRGDQLVENVDAYGPAGFPSILRVRVADDDGIWLGSIQSGVRHLWRARAERLAEREGLRDARVWSFLADGDAVLVGHNTGVDRLQHGSFTPVINSSADESPVAYALVRDADAALWIGTRRGLWRTGVDGKRERFDELRDARINGLLRARDDSIWIASSSGLFRAGRERPVQLQAIGDAAGLDEKQVRFVFEDRDGRFWIGTENGLFVQHQQRFQRIRDAELGDAFVTTILQTSNGDMVIGTYDRGLRVLPASSAPSESENWRRFTTVQGLPGDGVFYLGEHRGMLVVAYSNGAYRFSLAQLSGAGELAIDMLVLDEGEQTGRARIRCCNGAGNGKGLIVADDLLLPTLAGVLRVALDAPSPAEPVAQIHAVETAQGAVPLRLPLRLDSAQRSLTVRYGVSDFRHARQLRYRYRLVGSDENWHEVGDRTFALYDGLGAGEFVFEVQARHVFRPWGPVTRVTVLVPERFAESIWFRVLIAVLALALLLLWVRWRERRLLAQKMALELEVAARTRELQNVNRDLARINQQLQEASITDPLTGLRNRRFLGEQIATLLADLKRARDRHGDQQVLGMFLIDVDHFKEVNDRYGHAIGDRVLCRVANALRQVNRGSDYLLRWGGEEFLAVVPHIDASELSSLAERYRQAVAQMATAADEPGRLTVSIGYAGHPLSQAQADRSWQTTLSVADFALYAAKSAGRNRHATVQLRVEDLDRYTDERLIAQLSGWCEQGQAQLYIEPAPDTSEHAGRSPRATLTDEQ